MEVSSSSSTPVVKTEENIDVELDVSGEVEEVIQPQQETELFERPKRVRRSNPRYLTESTVEYGHPMEMSFDPEDELDVTNDMHLVRATNRMYSKHVEGDYGPVLYKFESSQRKKHVIVYNSVKYPNRASEWYFARRNASTENETYRCVTCRRYREEIKRGQRQGEINRPEARITVNRDRFLTDPDEPLGEHICNFENNEKTTLVAVWTKRALSKANSELRVCATKPRAKFDSLLEDFKSGEEYAHLPQAVREKIVEDLSSAKAFDARRRSFARNNKIAHKLAQGEYYNYPSYQCGLNSCYNKHFNTQAELNKHRKTQHPNMIFITDEDLKKNPHLARMNPNIMIAGEEIIVADEEEIKSNDNLGYRRYNEAQYNIMHADEEQNAYLHTLDTMIVDIKDCGIGLINDPARRETLLKYVREIHTLSVQLANEADQEIQVQVDDDKRPETSTNDKQ